VQDCLSRRLGEFVARRELCSVFIKGPRFFLGGVKEYNILLSGYTIGFIENSMFFKVFPISYDIYILYFIVRNSCPRDRRINNFQLNI